MYAREKKTSWEKIYRHVMKIEKWRLPAPCRISVTITECGPKFRLINQPRDSVFSKYGIVTLKYTYMNEINYVW